MMPAHQRRPVSVAGRGTGARIFVVAMGLALATASGALLTAVGKGDLQGAVRMMGFAGGSDIETGLRAQAVVLAKLDIELRRLRSETIALKSLATDARAADVEAHVARLEAGYAELRVDAAGLRARVDETAAATPWRRDVDDLKAGLAQVGMGIGSLRSSLDADGTARRGEIADIAKRLDRLEQLRSGDVTGSVAPQRRKSLPRLVGWSVEQGHDGSATITGHSGTFEVTAGTVVPGIGRVASVRQRASRWIVVTAKGVIVQR